jgi:hypothetical protein
MCNKSGQCSLKVMKADLSEECKRILKVNCSPDYALSQNISGFMNLEKQEI